MAFIPELKKDLEKLIKGGKLAQSYIFFGESVGEQSRFARTLANFLEFKVWAEPERPLLDAAFIEAGTDGGIEASREAIGFLWQMPVRSATRTLVVNGAERLTLSAQNAILKIAEEPPPHALIVLVVRDPEALIAPLASRFQKVYVSKSKGERLEPSAEIRKLVAQTLRAPTPKERTEIIKLVLEREGLIDDFVAGLIHEFHKDPLHNWQTLKGLVHRWQLMNQYNLNKRLQLEAALLKQ